jgi:hypothetical protein
MKPHPVAAKIVTGKAQAGGQAAAGARFAARCGLRRSRRPAQPTTCHRLIKPKTASAIGQAVLQAWWLRADEVMQ